MIGYIEPPLATSGGLRYATIGLFVHVRTHRAHILYKRRVVVAPTLCMLLR